jgi:hypothetical protein
VAEQWSEITTIEWEDALTRLPWTPRPDTGPAVAYALRAACPRCAHEHAIDLEHPVRVILDRAQVAAPITPEIYVQCECTGEHPGRPAGETGCGSRASIQFTIPAGRPS